MRQLSLIGLTVLLFGTGVTLGFAQDSALHGATDRARCVETSADGMVTTAVCPADVPVRQAALGGGFAVYGNTPDWASTLRRQVGGLQAADMNGDGLTDLVAVCYQSNSFPPYEDWRNLIYFNTGSGLEADPSWVSVDEVSTGDVQVGDIDGDGFMDVFAANGGFAMSDSVIYFGSASGPSMTAGWSSNEPGNAWNNYAIIFDVDKDGDSDVFTANQGNSEFDPARPMYGFINDNGTLETTPSWQSDEVSLQNFLAVADWDGDGWEDLAVTKWTGFETAIYRNNMGTLDTTPTWTIGDTNNDKGVAWADVDGNGEPDLAVGRNPTRLYSNTGGVLTQTWSSGGPFFGHSDLRFADVDHDGDPDLAEVHFSDGRTHIYENVNGTPSTAPSWTYDASPVGTAIAFGDFNSDGLIDLAIGYSGEPSIVIFYNQTVLCPWDCAGDNGVVNIDDMFAVINAISTQDPACDVAPDNGDGTFGNGVITFDDLIAVINNFGPCD